jgi:nicotinamidase/pyrazinamidase
MMKGMNNKTALIFIDLQNDFFPGGSLGVPGADAIFPLANTIQDRFNLVIATQDWHPKNHKSFANNHPSHKIFETVVLNGLPQVLWPDHCVQDTKGAELHSSLRRDKIHKIIHKGTDPEIDSYSAFFDNAHQKETKLNQFLKEKGIDTVYIMGLATDYCALYTVLDAVHLGYETYLIEDGCFGINQKPNDVANAIEQMKSVGAIIIKSDELEEI